MELVSNMVEINKAELSDFELVQLTLQNSANYKYLIEKYDNKLSRYIQRIIFINSEDSEDILQDVFIKAYKNLNGFNPKYKFSSWIYRIAHNEAISFLRSGKVRNNEIDNDVEEDIFETLASEVNLEKEILIECNSKYVHKILSKLDDKYRDVLVLKFFEEKDYDEISDILHMSSGTVGSLISRAKDKFKQIVENEKISG
jgi:RNA polymerase sigma-70 factor (ECF subfamily)